MRRPPHAKDSYVIAVIPIIISACPFADDHMKDPLMIVAGVSVTFGKSAGARMSSECESVLDHFERASAFLALGNKTPHLKLKRWAYLSALNSLRAVFEITSTALEESHLKGDPELFDREAEEKVLYFKTVENVRIQDFHRRALLLQPVRMDSLGTVEFKLGNSPTTAPAFLNEGTGSIKVEQKTGRVKQIRPVDWNGFGIFCEEENKYVAIWDVVRIHFESLMAFIKPYYIDWPSQESPRATGQPPKTPGI
jgi:hypothetical protein